MEDKAKIEQQIIKSREDLRKVYILVKVKNFSVKEK